MKNKRRKKKFLNHIDLLPYLISNKSLEEIIKQIQNDHLDSLAIADLTEDEFYKYLYKKYPKVLVVKHLGHYIVRDTAKYDNI